MSDSNGFIYDPNGINLDVVKDIKEVKRGRIKEYAERVPGSVYTEGQRPWGTKCDIALPCATQNELNEENAKALIANGCKFVAEGANMPSTPEAVAAFQAAGVFFGPAKAANAGGVATSGLEMSQNSLRLSWTFEEVDQRLHDIMVNIFHTCITAAEKYGHKDNLVMGANIGGFEKTLTLCWLRAYAKTFVFELKGQGPQFRETPLTGFACKGYCNKRAPESKFRCSFIVR